MRGGNVCGGELRSKAKRMQNDECRMQNEEKSSSFCILHSDFCIHLSKCTGSPLLRPLGSGGVDVVFDGLVVGGELGFEFGRCGAGESAGVGHSYEDGGGAEGGFLVVAGELFLQDVQSGIEERLEAGVGLLHLLAALIVEFFGEGVGFAPAEDGATVDVKFGGDLGVGPTLQHQLHCRILLLR